MRAGRHGANVRCRRARRQAGRGGVVMARELGARRGDEGDDSGGVAGRSTPRLRTVEAFGL